MTDTDQQLGPTSEQLVQAIPHLSYRQLDYWIRQGYLDHLDAPGSLEPGSGRQRRFTPAEVLHLRHMAHLTGELHMAAAWATGVAATAVHLVDGSWMWHHTYARTGPTGLPLKAGSLSLQWRLPPSQTAQLADVLEVALP
jgi:hypothetical protein